MPENQAAFEVYALVELFGHQRIAGKVSEQVIAGTGFIRVDVPATRTKAAYTRFYNPSAVYGITPVDEAAVQLLAESIYSPQIIPLTATMRQLAEERDDGAETDD